MRRAGALISTVALVVCGIGCGSHDSVSPEAASGAPVDAEAGNGALGTFERPAPGAMVPSPPEPITLESAWAWRDIWIPFKDLEVCKFQAFGLKDPADTSAGKEFTADDLDNHVVFTFEKSAFEAGQCTGLRVQLPNSKCAALWWAREDDIKPSEYPFSPERFKPLKNVEPGVFEIDLKGSAENPNWTGRIRLIRIDTYGNVGDKIAIGKFQGNIFRTYSWLSVKPVEVSLKLDGNKTAMALLKRVSVTGALVDLQSLGTLWYNSPWYATDQGRAELKELGMQQGLKLLDAGDAKSALAAFSAVARGSGKRVEFLYELRDRLIEPQRAALWPDGRAYLYIEDFSGPKPPTLSKAVENQGRTVTKSEIVPNASPAGGPAASLELSASTQDGESRYYVRAIVPLSEKPFGIRAYVKEDAPSDVRLWIGYWFEAAQKSSATVEAPTQTLDNGWTLFDVRRDFLEEQRETAEKAGYDASDCAINAISLILRTGPANRYWMAPIELYIP